MTHYIKIKGARVNNLKNVSVDIPRDKLVAIAGVSGSGKSSLAFDTLYAEGQRRYVESLSSYARQFLGRMSKPECDFIAGLPPAIAIEQKVISRNPRSTVGTSTEIYEFMRLLFARVGQIFSPVSNQEVRKHSPEDVVNRMLSFTKGTRFMLLAPLCAVEGRSLRRQLEMEILQGYSRIYHKGEVVRIEDFLAQHTDKDMRAEDIYLLIDRMSVDDSPETVSRLTDSAETAFYEGRGACRLLFLPSGIVYDFSTRLEADGITFEEPSDGLFAFNSPIGVCPTCEGFGKVMGIDEQLVIPNPSLSVYEGCVQCWHGEKMKEWQTEFIRRAQHDDFPIFKPYYELSDKEKGWLWHGLPSDQKRPVHEQVSIDAFFQMVKENQYKIQYRVMLSRYRGKTLCPDCHGARLRKEANYVKVGGKTITELVEMPVSELAQWFDNLHLAPHRAKIADRLLTEIKSRLRFLLDVGLDYLTLNRPSNTLSGGESQRINLTTSLGSSLVGSLYILDEPSIGMHSCDTEKLIGVLKKLRDIGNTVVVVEHDEDILRAADYLIDVGPDAGVNGGKIMFAGQITPQSLPPSGQEGLQSHTLAYLSGIETIEVPATRRPWNRRIVLKGARMNNLKGDDAVFPLNVMTVVTGVSGSGKSSLVKGTLYPIMKRRLDMVADIPGAYSSLEGDVDVIKHVEMVDQNPIGKSTRSNPATYIKAYDAIRQLFAEQPLAGQMNITPQHFSFNTEGGRCEECKGAGVVTVEMQFMADLTLTCDSCHGQRFKRDVLEVRFAGKNINDVLSMTVTEAIAFFSEEQEKEERRIKQADLRQQTRGKVTLQLLRAIISRLLPLESVGLGYIQLGQPSSTLSGGENQRVKLAYYISLERQEPTLFIFDEPTTGLHFHDIKRLLHAFSELLKRGHTIIVVEHNMDVIKCADHIIDLGPEGGKRGGEIVACGTPEEIVKCERSITGRYLAEKLSSL